MNQPARQGSVFVAAGILASRVAGLIREVVARRVLGNGAASDALVAAIRIPNLLQNLLGEGVLSASFVPVYSELLDQDRREASRVAGAVAAMLMMVTALCVLIIVFAARPITRVLAWGLTDASFELAVNFTRITAIGIGFLVMSAWCLGILNSHRQFLLPYAAPVIWNLAQVVALVIAWQLDWPLEGAAEAVAIAVTVGAVLQLTIQLPAVLQVVGELRPSLSWKNPWVADVRRRFFPAVAGRGVVQLSAYLDLLLASFLAAGALSALFAAQMLYLMPVSLFAMSVAAAELPEMSRLAGSPEAIVERANLALSRIVFWMMASAVLLVAAGEPIVALLFEGGEFTGADTSLVWLILVFYSLGLPAIGMSRLLQNSAFAIGDTSGPARIAAVRVLVATVIGVACMFQLDRAVIGTDGVVGLFDGLGSFAPLDAALRENDSIVRLGAVGLALGSAIGAWTEVLLLSGLLRRRLPGLHSPIHALGTVAVAGGVAFVVTAGLKLLAGGLPSLVSVMLLVGVGGFVYVVACFRTGVQAAHLVLRPARRILWRR